MRFVVTGEWTRNSLLKLVIGLFLVYVALLWVTNLLIFTNSMGFSMEAVANHYLGTASAWGAPAVARSYKVLLEISHAHLMMLSLLILTLTHLVLFAEISNGCKAWITIVTFISALLNEACGWLIIYVHPNFALMKIVMFSVFQLSLLVILFLLSKSLLKQHAN